VTAATTSLELDVGSTEVRRAKIAILLGAPLTDQNYERIGIPYLSAHFDVVTIDCLGWLGRSTQDIPQHRQRWGAVVPVSSGAELGRAIAELRPAHAIDFIGRGPFTAEIQNVLAATGVKFVVQRTGSLPRPGILGRLHLLLRRSVTPAAAVEGPSATSLPSRERPFDVFARRLSAVLNRGRDLLDPDIGLLAGRGSLDSFTRRSGKIIWIASQDAHLYARAKVAWRQKQGATGPPYILFVDDYLPHASDWKLLGLRPPVTAESYYRSMRQFMDDIEAHLGLPVTIAAHPSSRHDAMLSENFGGRRVVIGETAQLVLGSRLVLLHASTAVSFAVLDEKATVFLTSDELKRSSYGLTINAMANSLGGRILNIDSPQAAMRLSAEPSINRQKYARYIDRYLRTSEATETEAWQAFSEFVLQNNATLVD